MDGVKHGIDAVGAIAVFMSIVHALPDVLAAVASLLTIVWYTIRLSEWLGRRHK